MDKINSPAYETRDIYIASTLLALTFPILRVEKREKTFYFIFGIEREPMIGGDSFTPEKAVETYWQKRLEIEPSSLFNAFKQLKNMMYSYE